MCDLICDVITCCVVCCDTDKINASDKIIFENQKEDGNKDIFNINLHPKDRLDIQFTACKSDLIPEEALTSFTVSDAYRLFAGQV